MSQASPPSTRVNTHPATQKDNGSEQHGVMKPEGLGTPQSSEAVKSENDGMDERSSNNRSTLGSGAPSGDKAKVGMNSTNKVSVNAAAMAKYYLLPGHQYNQEQFRNAVLLAAQIVEKQSRATGKVVAEGGKVAEVNSTTTSENSTSGSIGNETSDGSGAVSIPLPNGKSSPPVYTRAQAALIRASQQERLWNSHATIRPSTGPPYSVAGAANTLRPTWVAEHSGESENIKMEPTGSTTTNQEENVVRKVDSACCAHAHSVSSTALAVARNLHSSVVEENEKLSTTYRVGDLVKILHDERFGGDMRGVFEASVYEVRGTLLTVRYMGDTKGLYDETIDVLFHHKRIRKHGVLDRSRLRIVGSMTEPPPESIAESPLSDFASMGAVETLPSGDKERSECMMTPALVESCLAVFGRTLPEFDRGYIPRMCRSARSRMHALITLDEPDQALAALCHHLDLQLGFSELHFFSVDFTRQRQGLGSWLLKRWLALLASSGVHYVITYASENAISWYEKHGFVHKRDMTLPERHIRGRVTLCTGAKLMELNLQDHLDQRPSIQELRAKLERVDRVVRHQKKEQQQQRRLRQCGSSPEGVNEGSTGFVTATVDGKAGLQIQSVNEQAMLVKVNGNWLHVNYPGLQIHFQEGTPREDTGGLSEVSTEERELTPPSVGEDADADTDNSTVCHKRGLPVGDDSPAKRRCLEPGK
ncbi:hypothetical protein Pmar_PMAR017278 [Perkinsus marinus ATCC 50983]|uniref:N-acetyltransferase domain-containing protein n=1 Tax=Perkinsus marinus (strain ATCC 50983 / TXsc) TaxID=423536 RepID=C5LH55_PERM5|nr:hypothetical protein Pmar_PMAR017278 [Perkinsus marinus ATCC 50983]EER03864.1 hypothetical protein Pmar_PMAR017278 [Perkinsus marinus ATCC 50983]|eukprot:XP_002772048.1 hypothetical protein Pmar_PMAR017278 [Perkinsus marinus ATCC 50983]